MRKFLLRRQRLTPRHIWLTALLALGCFAGGVLSGNAVTTSMRSTFARSPFDYFRPTVPHGADKVSSGEQGPWFYLQQLRSGYRDAGVEERPASAHVAVTSRKPYEAVKRIFEARLAKLDERMRAMTTPEGTEDFRSDLLKAAGKNGVIWHYTTTHGEWLLMRAGKVTPASEYFVGNILYPAEADGLDKINGLYAPLRIVLYENASGTATIEYDKPSAKLSRYHSKAIDAVGRLMDERIARLAEDPQSAEDATAK